MRSGDEQLRSSLAFSASSCSIGRSLASLSGLRPGSFASNPASRLRGKARMLIIGSHLSIMVHNGEKVLLLTVGSLCGINIEEPRFRCVKT